MYIASAQGMVILLYVVEERVMVMKREIKQVSEIDFLTDVHVTMQILWGVERHLIMRRTVLLTIWKSDETYNSTSCKEAVLDSGSVSNLMGLEYRALNARGLNAKMDGFRKQLYEYGGEKLEVVGHFSAEISVGVKTVNSQFVVIERGRCLLGHANSNALGLLRIGPGADVEGACNAVGKDLATFLQPKHPKVFDGVGKLKDYKLKLHVEPQVTPIAQKPRRVPFELREKVTAKEEQLIAMDIFERVDRPTSWVSPVGVSPKTSVISDFVWTCVKQIRLLSGSGYLSQLLENLNGGRVFSK